MDKTIMYWENKGKLVPTRELIKTPEQIEGIRKAGVVTQVCSTRWPSRFMPACPRWRSTRYAASTARIITPSLPV